MSTHSASLAAAAPPRKPDRADLAKEALRRAATARGITVAELSRRILETVAADDLFVAVLDDAKAVAARAGR